MPASANIELEQSIYCPDSIQPTQSNYLQTPLIRISQFNAVVEESSHSFLLLYPWNQVLYRPEQDKTESRCKNLQFDHDHFLPNKKIWKACLKAHKNDCGRHPLQELPWKPHKLEKPWVNIPTLANSNLCSNSLALNCCKQTICIDST